jgi:hypothetical protein
MAQMTVPKRLWALWLQGWDDAPEIVRACRASWSLQNPYWTTMFLTRESLYDFVTDPDRIRALEARGIPPAAFSDVVRNALLARHGGVWVDATTYCLRPLDGWIGYAAASGFFAFSQPGADRMISSWFLASEPECHIPRVWLKRSHEYWEDRTKPDHYYWLHRLFADLYRGDGMFRAIWDETPRLSADGPHSFLPYRTSLLGPVSDFHRLVVDTIQTPMLKLSHKIDHSRGRPGTVYRWLCDRAGVIPASRR